MITLSASQLKTAALCRRKRYFERAMNLPQVSRNHHVFGTLLHAVLERYLEADNTGRDADGKPVELYPEGWDCVVKLEGGREAVLCDVDTTKNPTVLYAIEIDAVERTMIQTLVAMAIEEGVVERRPGGEVEQFFEIPLEASLDARIIGFIDYSDKVSIDDHKTTKSRRYLLSSNKLTEDLQMMIYAAAKLMGLRERGEAIPEYIELAHNGFIKGGNTEDPGVRKTRAKVTPDQVVAYWNNTVMPLVRQIIEDSKVTDPFALPNPEEGACAAYGGCPFLNICSRQESIPQYRKRIERLNENTYKKLTEGQTMNLQDFLAKRLQKTSSPSPTPAPEVAPEVTTEATPEAAPAPSEPSEPTSSAPWAVATCRACTGVGINSKGQMCRICLLKNRAIAERYRLEAGNDGSIRWVAKDALAQSPIGSVKLVEPAPAEERAAKQVIQVEQKKVVEPAPEQEVVIIQKPAETPAVKPTAATVAPVRGFGIFVKCSIHSPFQEQKTTVEAVLATLRIEGEVLYYDERDPWKRRDYLSRNSRAIAETLVGFHLYQLTSTPDGDVLVAALTPHAELVVRGNI